MTQKNHYETCKKQFQRIKCELQIENLNTKMWQQLTVTSQTVRRKEHMAQSTNTKSYIPSALKDFTLRNGRG